MLRISIHSGLLADHNIHNQMGVLDIAYGKKEAMADYLVGLSLRNVGETPPNSLSGYPRWSGSLWDLTARALTRALYAQDQAPPAAKPDKRCAYATRMCAVIEGHTLEHRGRQLAGVQILQNTGQRGVYTATFDEDILGPRMGHFEFGAKRLNPAELLLRAICWTLYGKDNLGPRPKLILPATLAINGVDSLDVESLDEPAKTGFKRFLAAGTPTAQPQALARAEDYVTFLMQG